MIWLLLSVVCNAMLFVVLRSYSHFNVKPFPALVVNYFTAGLCGFLVPGTITSFLNVQESEWFLPALGTGAVFISVFVLVSRAANTLGISTASVANKMSFVMPVMVGIWIFGEELNFIRVMAFLLAAVAVVLVSMKKQNDPEKNWSSGLGLGLLVFLGSGLVDAIVSYMQQTYFMEGGFIPYVSLSFLSAGTIGVVILILQRVEPGKKEIRGGILLGLPNFISIACMMAALGEKLIDSGVLFAVSNMGVVILSTFSSILFYRERLSALNWIGLSLGSVAILLIGMLDR